MGRSYCRVPEQAPPMSTSPEPAWSEDPQALAGNAAAAEELRGRGICTDYGDFEVLPDDQAMCAVPTVPGTEVISEQELGAGAALWSRVESEDGSLTTDPVDRDAEIHPGWADEAHTLTGRLMQTRSGRRLVQDAVEAPMPITLTPARGGERAVTSTTSDALVQADGTPGTGAPAIVSIEPGLGPQPAMREDGTFYDTPPEVVLGHELGHAVNDTHGRNRSQLPPTDEVYRNGEEEQVIQQVEDPLLIERGLGPRFGHGQSCEPRP